MPVKVSIIIPLYNKEEYIERALKCIEDQSFEDWECIIIDDGSTDGSAVIVKNFISNRGNKWRYLRQKIEGKPLLAILELTYLWASTLLFSMRMTYGRAINYFYNLLPWNRMQVMFLRFPHM